MTLDLEKEEHAAPSAEELAFRRAVLHGVMSEKVDEMNFAALYRYVWSEDGRDIFQHIITGEYLEVK